jgi:hypothetical protein
VRTTGALLTAAVTITVAACGGTASGGITRTAADQRLCAAVKDMKQRPGIPSSLAVISDGKNATGPYRAAVIQFATAAIHGPQSAVTAAERKLYATCGL